MSGMKPTHPVELLVCAIATQEENHATNPGNLRYAGQAGASRPDGYTGPIRSVEPIAVFVNRHMGITALFRDIWAKVALGLTVKELIFKFAPPNENNSAKYLADVLFWTGLPPDEPVLSLLPELLPLNR
jgi:hypothetical protein